MEWDDLTARQKNRFNAILSKTYFNNSQISVAGAEKLAEEIGGVTATNVRNLLERQYGYWEEKNKVFHPEDGVISNFALGNVPVSTMQFGGHRIRKIQKLITRMAGQPLLPTQEGIENKDALIQKLQEAQENEEIARGVVPFTDEELEIINSMVSGLERDDDADYKKSQERKMGEFKSLRNIIRTLSKANKVTTKARQDYYKYWEEIHGEFENLSDYLKKMQPFFAQLEGIPDVEGELKESIKNTKLPNYVIKVTPFKKKELIDDWKVQKLTYECLKYLGHAIPQSLKVFGAKSDIRAKLHATERSDLPYLVEGKGLDYSANPEGSFDPTAIEEEMGDVNEQIDAMEKVDVLVDPLFLLLTSDSDITENYQADVLSKVKEEVKKAFDFGEEEKLVDILNESLGEEIDAWLENFAETQALSENLYYISLLDNQDSIEILSGVKGKKFTVEYIKFTGEDAEIKNTEPMEYAEAVDYINQQTEKFFCTLGDLIELTGGTGELLNKPRKTAGIGREDAETMYMQGSVHIPLPGKATEWNVKKRNELGRIESLIEKYYTAPINSEYILLDDKPSFSTSKCYTRFLDIITGTTIERATKQLRSGATPIAGPTEYANMIKLMNELKDVENLTYSGELEDLFEYSMDSYLNFFSIAASINDEDNILKTLSDRIVTIFGEALYDIAMDTWNGDENKFKDKRWEEQPLKYWNDLQEEKGYRLENLVHLLETKEYKDYVERAVAKGSKIKTAHRKLVSLLMESSEVFKSPLTNAMLEATDIIRKMKNMKVYNSNLDINEVEDLELVINMIKKQHGVDIYGVDIYNIVTSQSSFNNIAKTHGVSDEVIYKIKGMFR